MLRADDVGLYASDFQRVKFCTSRLPLLGSHQGMIIRMLPLAPGINLLSGFPRNQINIYLVNDLLVDAGYFTAKRRILRQVGGLGVKANVITHAHPDHFGSSHAVCTQLGIPLWASELDSEAIAAGRPVTGPGPLSRLLGKFPKAAAHPVDRVLVSGDEVAGFSVLHAPGHTPGHIALWRESDGVLLCGDVFFNFFRPTQPPRFLSWRPELNRESMLMLSNLKPRLVLFGHGKPKALGPSERLLP